MKNVNVQNVSMVEELQEQLTEDFTVTQDSQGNIQIYSNIEEYQLSQDEIQLLLQNLGYEIKWYLQDDEGKYVHADSCKRINKNEYIYVSYDKLERSYTTQAAAEIALLKLERACYFCKINHHFTIKSIISKPKSYFVIVDKETGNYVSSDSVFITKDEILFSTHTGRADELEYSNSYEVAAEIANRVKTTLEKYHIHKSFKIIEVVKENLPKGEMVIEHFSKMIVGVIS